ERRKGGQMVVDKRERETRIPIQFRSRAAEVELDRRRSGGEGRGARAAADLVRYYALLEQELGSITLTEAEARLIVLALQDAPLDPRTLRRVLWAVVAEAVAGGRAPGVAGDALVERLRDLCPGTAAALVDAVERVEILV